MFKLRKIDGQAILVPIGKTTLPAYFMLNDTASYIWGFYCSGADELTVVNELAEKYPDVARNDLHSDVRNTFVQFAEISDGKVCKSLYSTAEKEFRKKASTIRTPIEGTLELTFRCNLRCAHCYCVHCKHEKKELDTASVFRILEQLADKGCIWLLLTGGEPLVRKDFKDIYLHAKNLGFIVTLFTNALLIDDAYAKLFQQYPPHLLEISVYGASNDVYQSLCGSQGGYSKLTNALDLLDSYEIKYALKSVVVSCNESEFGEIRTLSESRGQRFRFDTAVMYQLNKLPVPSGVALGVKEAIALEIGDDLEEKRDVWKGNKLKRNHFSLNKLFYCEAGNTTFNINPSGEVSLCGRARNPAYNIMGSDFSAIWENLKEAARRPVPSDFKCTACTLLDYCKVCPAVVDMSSVQREDELCSYSRVRTNLLSPPP